MQLKFQQIYPDTYDRHIQGIAILVVSFLMQLFIRHGHVVTHSDKENKNKFFGGL